jgi:hypothetical protein
VLILQRPQAPCDADAGARMGIVLAVEAAAAPRRLRVGRGDRSALYSLHLRHHRPAQGRLCATMAAHAVALHHSMELGATA